MTRNSLTFLSGLIAVLWLPAAPAVAAAGSLSGKLCSDGAGYEIDFTGSGSGGSISGSLVNQQFVGHWRQRSIGVVITWQMVDEAGQSGRLVCSIKSGNLNCREGGSTYTFKCRKAGDTF